MAIVNGLTTLADARKSLNWADGDTTNDSDLEAYITAATPLIEAETGPMYLRDEVATFDGGRNAVLLPWRINSVTSVTENALTITDYVADLKSGILYAGTQTALRVFVAGTQNIVVTASVGYSTIPSNVQLATRECVRELWQIGRQGSRPGYGTEPADAAMAANGYVMSNRVRALLAPTPDVGGFA